MGKYQYINHGEEIGRKKHLDMKVVWGIDRGGQGIIITQRMSEERLKKGA